MKALQTAYHALQFWEKGALKSDAVLARHLDRAELDPQGRALAMELFHGCLRRLGTLDALIDVFCHVKRSRLEARLIWALRLGLYQLCFLDRTPAPVAVHHTVELLKVQTSLGGRLKRLTGMCNAVLRAAGKSLHDRVLTAATDLAPDQLVPCDGGLWVPFDCAVLPDPARDLAEYRAAAYSVPLWLVRRWETEGLWSPEDWQRVLDAAISRAPTSIRVNTARGDAESLRLALQAQGAAIAATPWPKILTLDAPGRLDALPAFQEGLFWVQDALQARVIEALELRNDAQVLDLCAAPGGKSLGLALSAGGVVALDRDGGGARLIEQSRRRLGLSNVRVLAADALAAPFSRRFDAVLLDAPCSNTGVMSRRSDVRWRLSPADFHTLPKLQRRLIAAAAEQVAPDGRLAYSTCSIDRVENEALIDDFLAARTDFRLVSAETTLPAAGMHEGGFLAILSR